MLLASNTQANGGLPVFMTAADFAAAFQITERAARKAFETGVTSKPWRGEGLPVVAFPGKRVAKGGMVWGLVLDKCSPAREMAFRDAAAQPRVIKGKIGYHAQNTLRDWVRLYEAKGAAGLMPALRKDRGAKRVLVTREWESGIDLPEATRAKIAQTLNEKARSMIANDGTSDREVIGICEGWLVCKCIDEGSALSRAELAPICALNPKWAVQFGLYRRVHAKNRDHKAWQDRFVPPIAHSLPHRHLWLCQPCRRSGDPSRGGQAVLHRR
jgi:hypothetical protein